MLDIGFTKLMIIGGIALVVIGPERLPRVARMAGTLLGRAQRYVADVKSEVNRSIELEELNKMKQQFDSAARDVEQSVQSGFDQASREAGDVMQQISGGASGDSLYDADNPSGWEPPGPVYVRPDKHWRVKRGAVPTWFKQREGVRRHVQSGAARVARHRPRRSIDVR